MRILSIVILCPAPHFAVRFGGRRLKNCALVGRLAERALLCSERAQVSGRFLSEGAVRDIDHA